VKFAEIRAAEMLRDAQSEEKRIANAQAKRNEGWISDEEASVEITGHEPTGEKLEIVPPGGGATDQGTATEDGEDGATTPPAAESGTTTAPTPATRTGERFVPLGAGDGPSEVPADVEITVDDAERALGAWDDALPEYAGLLDATVAEAGSDA
jgi:hypothetical protein